MDPEAQKILAILGGFALIVFALALATKWMEKD